jgi:hypothetical protein
VTLEEHGGETEGFFAIFRNFFGGILDVCQITISRMTKAWIIKAISGKIFPS